MLRQYLEIKERYQDCILFYRMGDFYEMFYDDAIKASRLLEITLTTSDRKKENPVPMCGVPFHAADTYITRLVRAGHKVAICEQIEDPREAKGIVKRDVVRVVTPGLISLSGGLEAKENNYLAAISTSISSGGHKETFGFSFLDISTGEFSAASFSSHRELLGEIFKLEPRELLLPEGLRDSGLASRLVQALPELYISHRPDAWFRPDRASQVLKEQFGVISLEGFGFGPEASSAAGAAGALLRYSLETQKADLSHINRISPYRLSDYLFIDEATKRNLELVQNSMDGTVKGSLLHILDRTRTAMGGRLLKRWLLYPLKDRMEIQRRLDVVQFYMENEELAGSLRELLKGVYDLERLLGRVVLKNANARDLVSLKSSLEVIPRIRQIHEALGAGPLPELLEGLISGLDPHEELVDLIHRAIREDAPLTVREGRLIKQGFSQELDELMEIQKGGRSFIASIEAKERERTGISSLKVGYNKVFGYYIEISKAKSAQVPEDYIRKQTLVNAERYITPELKEIEAKILTAQERRVDLEYRIFKEIASRVEERNRSIKESANKLAILDCLLSLADVAEERGYCRPELTEGFDLQIRAGRHPVVEAASAEAFVPNDVSFNQKDSVLILITGPNMAGKSTILRQTALIVLMAHMGSFVPADSASIPLTDQIFTRVGATDYLSRGQSTFMVEMNETANILHNATSKSLVVLDEIGRGTSTHDGLAIAWAVSEYLLDLGGTGVKTMFATHYHELTALEERDRRVKNLHVEVREYQGKIAFIHTLRQGGTSKSYGIQVAALAGVPEQVVSRAKEILLEIEGSARRGRSVPAARGEEVGKRVVVQRALPLVVDKEGELSEKLKAIDINNLTPLEALNLLSDLVEKAKAKGKRVPGHKGS
jgi:DNA mismatch repair protein MutS